LTFGCEMGLAWAEGFDGFGEALFEKAGAFGCQATKVVWYGGGCEYQDEGDYGEADACGGCGHEHVVHVEGVKAEDLEGYVLKWLDVVENGQGKEEEEDRERGENCKAYIEAAVKFLPRPAPGTLDKVLLVVLAHLGGDS